MKLFDILNHINEKTKISRDDVIPTLPKAFIINRAYSMGMDTVLYANEINQLHCLDKDMCYDFYYHILPKAKRFNKWAKGFEEDELISAVINKYKVSRQLACTYLSLMSDYEKEQLKIAKGGISGKSISGRKS
jgi:hypothetical protein